MLQIDPHSSNGDARAHRTPTPHDQPKEDEVQEASGLTIDADIPGMPEPEVSPAIEDDSEIALVRKVLFGRKEAEIDGHLKAMEIKVLGRLDKLEVLMDRRFGEMEKDLRGKLSGEIEKIDKRVEEMEEKRASKAEEIRGWFEGFYQDANNRFQQLESGVAQRQNEVREELLGQIKEVAGELDKAADSFETTMEREVKRLQSSTTSRAQLGALLMDLGRQVQDEAPTENPDSLSRTAENPLERRDRQPLPRNMVLKSADSDEIDDQLPA